MLFPFNYAYFFFRQAVQFINQFINLLVGCVYLALEQRLFMAGFGFGMPRFVVDVPTQSLKEGIDELPAHLCFVISA